MATQVISNPASKARNQVELNPQPLPPGAEVELSPQPLPPGSDAPAWWPQLLWQLHFPIRKLPGVGPINYPPAIQDVMAGLHIHTMSYMMLDQAAAQQIRQITEQRLVHTVQNLSKSHDEAVKTAGRGRY